MKAVQRMLGDPEKASAPSWLCFDVEVKAVQTFDQLISRAPKLLGLSCGALPAMLGPVPPNLSHVICDEAVGDALAAANMPVASRLTVFALRYFGPRAHGSVSDLDNDDAVHDVFSDHHVVFGSLRRLLWADVRRVTLHGQLLEVLRHTPVLEVLQLVFVNLLYLEGLLEELPGVANGGPPIRHLEFTAHTPSHESPWQWRFTRLPKTLKSLKVHLYVHHWANDCVAAALDTLIDAQGASLNAVDLRVSRIGDDSDQIDDDLQRFDTVIEICKSHGLRDAGSFGPQDGSPFVRQSVSTSLKAQMLVHCVR